MIPEGFLVEKLAPALGGLFGGLSLAMFWTPEKLQEKGKVASVFIAGGISAMAGFAFTAAVAGGVGAAMAVRWTYIDPHTAFNPFIGFQTVLIALIGGAMTLWGPLIAAIVFSILAETLRLQAPQIYMMTLGLLLILSVLYLPGGLASMRWQTFKDWYQDMRQWYKDTRYEWSGDKVRDKQRAKERRIVGL